MDLDTPVIWQSRLVSICFHPITCILGGFLLGMAVGVLAAYRIFY